MLVFIGLGSLTGAWIGGRMTDRSGFYVVMLSSLFLTGFGIIAMLFLYDFIEICIGLFIVTTIADMYKPAMYVAVTNFTNQQNRTRALTLIRLSVNLGIITGPIIAGLLIKKESFDPIFWVDGITCIIAITAFMLIIDESKFSKIRRIIYQNKIKNKEIKVRSIPNKNYILFLFGSFITAVLFFQLFTTIPLYNSETLKLSEMQIALLLSLNGVCVFLFEMPIIGYLERTKNEFTKNILYGAIIMTSGFFFLMFSKSIPLLVISIVLITLGQILLFSFSNSFAIKSASIGQEGKHLAFYTMTFSTAQMIGPKIGFTIIENYDYFSNWLLMGVIGTIGIFLYYRLDKNIRIEKLIKIEESIKLHAA
jgi:predicted MFS family arabinose efflux permease